MVTTCLNSGPPFSPSLGLASQDVLDHDAARIAGLYAAGEMIGGIFYFNYPSGAGLVSGAVFGRLAGASAAQYKG